MFCTPSAVPPIVRSEGITERTGDILLDCTRGTPGAIVKGNLTVFLNVSVTNKLLANNTTDVLLTVDTGTIIQGPVIGTNTTGQEPEGPHCTGGGH